MAKILIAIGTKGSIHAVTSMSVSRIVKQRDDTDYVTVRGRPLDYVRNSLLRTLQQQHQYSHLFMVDDDVGLPLDALDKLLACDATLATGCYPALSPTGIKWVLGNKCSDGHYRLLEGLVSSCKPFQVDVGGAGCLLIRRDLVEKVEWPWFKWVEYSDGHQMTEDIHFFDKCCEAGIRTTVEPTVICDHFKAVNLRTVVPRTRRYYGEDFDGDPDDVRPPSGDIDVMHGTFETPE